MGGYFVGYKGFLGEQLMRDVILTLAEELKGDDYSNAELTVLLKDIKKPMEKNIEIIKAFNEKIVSNKKGASSIQKAGRTIKNALSVVFHKTFMGSSRKTLIKNYNDITTKIKSVNFGRHIIVQTFCIGVADAAQRTANAIQTNPDKLFTSDSISKDIL